MTRKRDPFGHPIPPTHQPVGLDLKDYPGKVVERMPPPPKQLNWIWPWLICSIICAMILVATSLGRNAEIEAKQAIIDDLSTQLQVDNDVLQWVFEKQYDRDSIELTEVAVSAYPSTRDQTDDTPWQTADGSNVMVGQIAVSRDLINKGVKFGSVVYLEGLGVFRVTDVMAPRWKNKVDIWCADRTACKVFGNRNHITMIWMRKEE